LLDSFLTLQWLAHGEGRVLTFTRKGLIAFDSTFGVKG